MSHNREILPNANTDSALTLDQLLASAVDEVIPADDVADLEASIAPTAGRVARTTNDGSIYLADGTDWVPASEVSFGSGTNPNSVNDIYTPENASDIQNALDDAAGGGRVRLLGKTYSGLSTTLTHGSDIIIEGQGVDATTIQATQDTLNRLLESENPPDGTQNVVIRDLTLDANWTTGSTNPLGATLSLSGTNLHLRNVKLVNGQRHDLALSGMNTSGGWFTAFNVITDGAIGDDGVTIQDGSEGWATASDDQSQNVYFSHCQFLNSGDCGFEPEYTDSNVYFDHIETRGNLHPFRFRNAGDVYINDWSAEESSDIFGFQDVGEVRICNSQLPNVHRSPTTGTKYVFFNCDLGGWRIENGAPHRFRDCTIAPTVSGRAALNLEDNSQNTNVVVEGCILDGSDGDVDLLALGGSGGGIIESFISQNTFRNVPAGEYAIEFRGSGDIPRIQISQNSWDGSGSNFVNDNSGGGSRSVELTGNTDSGGKIRRGDLDNISTVTVSLDGMIEKSLSGSAPDATNFEEGDKVRDTDNADDVYLVYDPSVSGGVTQLST